jgi:hypothetical protein
MKLRLALACVLASVPLLVAPAVEAQTPGCTQIVDTIYAMGVSVPVTMTGTIDLTLGYFASDGSFVIVASAGRQTIVAGALSACLPPGSYTAKYIIDKTPPLTGTSTATAYWTVPASGGPYTVQYIQAHTPVTPSLSIAWAQLPAPPSPGTYCVESVSGVIGWGACTGGGTTYTTWTSLGSLTWSGLNGTWTALF